MRKALRTLVTVSALLLVFLLSSCSEQKEEPAQFYIYYRDTSSNNLYPVAARINEGASQSALLKAVYDQRYETYLGLYPALKELFRQSLKK